MRCILASALLAVGPAAGLAQERSEIKEEIAIRGRGTAAGPPVQAPPPRAERAVVDQVLRSLDLYRTDFKAAAPKARVPAGPKRLKRPFPSPPYLIFYPRAIALNYQSWSFEVLEDAKLIWRKTGEGKLEEPIEWDGGDARGRRLVRPGLTYSFRFVVKKNGQELSLTSEPLPLKSLSYRGYLGETFLEVSGAEIFEDGKADFRPDGRIFLAAMSQRLRQLNIKDDVYRLILHQAQPRAALARRRAENLRKYFSEYLVINPKRIAIEILSSVERGEALIGVLPAESGATFSVD